MCNITKYMHIILPSFVNLNKNVDAVSIMLSLFLFTCNNKIMHFPAFYSKKFNFPGTRSTGCQPNPFSCSLFPEQVLYVEKDNVDCPCVGFLNPFYKQFFLFFQVKCSFSHNPHSPVAMILSYTNICSISILDF